MAKMITVAEAKDLVHKYPSFRILYQENTGIVAGFVQPETGVVFDTQARRLDVWKGKHEHTVQ